MFPQQVVVVKRRPATAPRSGHDHRRLVDACTGSNRSPRARLSSEVGHSSACLGVSRPTLAGSWLRGPTGQVSRQVGAGAAGHDPTAADRVRPHEPPGGQKHKRDRIGLDHVRWGASGMGRSFDTLNRAKRWNPHLHRTAGCLLPKRRQQHTDRVTQQCAVRRLCCVKRLNGGGHRVRFGTTRGHERTIRFDRRA